MSFVRPEVRAALHRWREGLVGALVTALGANWAFASHGLLGWLGWPVLALGLALLIAGVQRARVRPRTGGAGVIELDEGQLSYFHPEGGVIVALPLVVRIEVETLGKGASDANDLVWVFTDSSGGRARIPASALGAERLLDALARFSGADFPKLIAASSSATPQMFVIWRRDAARLH